MSEALPICGGSESVVRFGVGCGKPIRSVEDLYRCATCNVPMHVGCLRRHFGPGDGPLPTRVEELAMQLKAEADDRVAAAEQRIDELRAALAAAGQAAPAKGDSDG
jgi:hypothetical protein